MRDRDLTHGHGVLPLRPLTTGEVLDAAVVLLRAQGRKLIGWGIGLALAEQAVLFPLRQAADVDSRYLPATNGLALFGVMIVVGFATEAFIIGLLGGITATRAPQALLGPATRPRPQRLVALLIVALVEAVFFAGAAWSFLVVLVPMQVFGLVAAVLITALLLPLGYGLVGLAAPVVVIDQLGPGRALVRALGLASRTMLRGVWIRTLGYLAWLFIRFGLALAVSAIISLVYSSPSNTVDRVLLSTAFLLVNALAYPVLGCLDVALHLEIRMRTEGLDLALSRTLRRGVNPDTALALPTGRTP